MVIITPYPNWIPSTDPSPWVPNIIDHTSTFIPQTIEKKHIKNVKRGIFIEFEDGSWSFVATDDECFAKIKEAINEKV